MSEGRSIFLQGDEDIGRREQDVRASGRGAKDGDSYAVPELTKELVGLLENPDLET